MRSSRAEPPNGAWASGLDHLFERSLRRNLPADVALGDAGDGVAAEEPARVVEDPAIGSVGAEELDQLVDETLDHCLEAQITREHLRSLEKRGLLLDAPLVLAQEARCMDREPDLSRHGLRERHLARAPLAGLGAMEAEDTHHAVEDEDRRGGHRTGAEIGRRVPPAERQ